MDLPCSAQLPSLFGRLVTGHLHFYILNAWRKEDNSFICQTNNIKKIYLFLAALGLRCCLQLSLAAFSFFVEARGLLIVVASLVAEHRL